MKPFNNKLLLISIFILFALACEDKNENCDFYTGRGNLISYELITEYTKETFEILIGLYGFDPSEFDIQNDVKIYRVIYESLGAKG